MAKKRPSVFRLAPDPVRDSGLKAKERRLWAEIAGDMYVEVYIVPPSSVIRESGTDERTRKIL
jgi:hypothetical protein